MAPSVSRQGEVEDSSPGHVSTPRQRHDDAVDVLTEALWELWLRRHSQVQKTKKEERTNG